MPFMLLTGQVNDSFRNFNIRQLSDGVLACIHNFGGKAICNSTIVDNGDATIIFDCFLSPEAAEDLKTVVKQYNLSPIKFVINSHYHNDHIRGNQVFDEGVVIISTKRTAELIEKMEPLEIADEQTYAANQFLFYDSLYQHYSGSKDDRQYQQILLWRPYFQVLSKSQEEIRTVVPTKFVEDSLSLNGSKRKVKLVTKGGGHTESDLVAYLPDDKILLSGDLIFNEAHPYLGNGSIEALFLWFNYFEELEIELIVPGHGEVGQAELIGSMRNYLMNIQHAARKWKTVGKTVDDLALLSIPEEYKSWWFDRFYTYNFRFVLNSLE
jgi:glyoxylase-like metal-dependent hydrolase (beta-lactamase superfamily II)